MNTIFSMSLRLVFCYILGWCRGIMRVYGTLIYFPLIYIYFFTKAVILILMIIYKFYQLWIESLESRIWQWRHIRTWDSTDVLETAPYTYNCAQYTLHEQVVREFELDSSKVRSLSLLAIKEGWANWKRAVEGCRWPALTTFCFEFIERKKFCSY